MTAKRKLMAVCRRCADGKWAKMVELTAAGTDGFSEPMCALCDAVRDKCRLCPLSTNDYRCAMHASQYRHWWKSLTQGVWDSATIAALNVQLLLTMLADGEGVWPEEA